jgi:oxygen-independent coproporphyrinogen III oxidase
MLSADLIARYNRPGPRYTSYPTAPQFSPEFSCADYAQLLRSRVKKGLSLYFHLPFCRSMCNYCGCHMKVTHRSEVITRYVDHLLMEIDLVSDQPGEEADSVRQIHWGGGTPTYLAPDEIELIMAHTRSRFAVEPDAEVSIEADPRGLTTAHLESSRRAGFDRISFGVQCFDPDVQLAIGRIQPHELVRKAVDNSRETGFSGIAFDLIYGLPHQTPERFARTLERTVSMAPDRISVFSYAHVPWMKRHQRLIDEAALPSPEAKIGLFLLAIEKLTSAGYVRIGMDHFARKGDSLAVALAGGGLYRNFQGYSTHAGLDVLALGVSGISQLDRGFAQNVKDIPAYYAAVRDGRLPTERGLVLSDDDRVRRDVINTLMCHMSIDTGVIEKRWEIDFDAYFPGVRHALQALEQDGLVRGALDRVVEVTDTGRLFVRNVAMLFDAYLKAPSDKPVFSRTI